MKKLVIIFLIAFGVSVIGFFSSVAATGGIEIFSSEKINEYIDSQLKDIFLQKYEESFSSIEVKGKSSEIIIKKSQDNTASVEMRSTDLTREVHAEITDGKLVVSENTHLVFFKFSLFNDSRIIITVPEKEYDSIVFDLTSGSVRSEFDLRCKDFSAKLTSGNLKLNVEATESVYSYTTSGVIELTNPAGTHDKILEKISNGQILAEESPSKILKSLTVELTSGFQKLEGYDAENIKVKTTSGNASLTGISGHTEVNSTSGSITLNYQEWAAKSNDEYHLGVNITSGTLNVRLPAGSGLTFASNSHRTSGGLSFNLDGERGTLDSFANVQIGGSNKQKVFVKMTSGSVNFSNI